MKNLFSLKTQYDIRIALLNLDAGVRHTLGRESSFSCWPKPGSAPEQQQNVQQNSHANNGVCQEIRFSQCELALVSLVLKTKI